MSVHFCTYFFYTINAVCSFLMWKISFHFPPFDLATALGLHKSYTMTVVAEHLNCLGIGFEICFTSIVILKIYSIKIDFLEVLESFLTGNAFKRNDVGVLPP